jgi:hypothetical protein
MTHCCSQESCRKRIVFLSCFLIVGVSDGQTVSGSHRKIACSIRPDSKELLHYSMILRVSACRGRTPIRNQNVPFATISVGWASYNFDRPVTLWFKNFLLGRISLCWNASVSLGGVGGGIGGSLGGDVGSSLGADITAPS